MVQQTTATRQGARMCFSETCAQQPQGHVQWIGFWCCRHGLPGVAKGCFATQHVSDVVLPLCL
jgi:hypothetical protein